MTTGCSRRLVQLQLAAAILGSLVLPGTVRAATDPTSDVAIKAAFLYNFAKFTDWPALAADAPLTVCIVGDSRVAYALVDTVRNQRIGGHAIEAKAIGTDAPMRSCAVLFVAMSETRRAAVALDALKALPILTVSDGKDFARSGGVVELFIEDGRMRFYINTDAADRAGLHLSSRLLSLARIVKDEHAPGAVRVEADAPSLGRRPGTEPPQPFAPGVRHGRHDHGVDAGAAQRQRQADVAVLR